MLERRQADYHLPAALSCLNAWLRDQAGTAKTLQLLLAVEKLTPVTADRAAEGGWHHRML